MCFENQIQSSRTRTGIVFYRYQITKLMYGVSPAIEKSALVKDIN